MSRVCLVSRIRWSKATLYFSALGLGSFSPPLSKGESLLLVTIWPICKELLAGKDWPRFVDAVFVFSVKIGWGNPTKHRKRFIATGDSSLSNSDMTDVLGKRWL